MWTIAAKDLHSELRTKEAWNASIAFSVVILLLFSFAFDPSSEQIREFSGGLLWMTYAFAGALVLNRSFARELQNDCLDALIASPVSSAALFVGKALANFALLFAVELVSLPVFVLFYNMPWGAAQVGPMLLVLMLGTWALTVIGTLVQRAHRESPIAGTNAADARLSDDDSGADRGHHRHHQRAGGKSSRLGNTSAGWPSISSLRCWPWFLWIPF